MLDLEYLTVQEISVELHFACTGKEARLLLPLRLLDGSSDQGSNLRIVFEIVRIVGEVCASIGVAIIVSGGSMSGAIAGVTPFGRSVAIILVMRTRAFAIVVLVFLSGFVPVTGEIIWMTCPMVLLVIEETTGPCVAVLAPLEVLVLATLGIVPRFRLEQLCGCRFSIKPLG